MIDVSDGDHHYAGSVSGGVWESWDRGKTWAPQSDHDENLTISYFAQNPFDPDIIYFSTGEAAFNSANVDGLGVFKSIDHGQTFELLTGSEVPGLLSSWRIVCSKTDPNTLYVATPTGVYASYDAGISFERVFNNYCNDIELQDDGTIFISSRGHGIFRGNESNLNNLQKLSLPDFGTNGFSRIDIAYCDSSPNVLYAVFEDNTTSKLLAIIKSEDGGDNWVVLPKPSLTTRSSWFNQTIAVHPSHPDVIVYGNVFYATSSDGGNSWKLLQSGHADQHLFYFDPTNNDHAISTNDGGLDEIFFYNEELNYGGSLRNGFNVTQYYSGDIFPYENRVIGGAQDNGTTTGTDKSQVFEKI